MDVFSGSACVFFMLFSRTACVHNTKRVYVWCHQLIDSPARTPFSFDRVTDGCVFERWDMTAALRGAVGAEEAARRKHVLAPNFFYANRRRLE